MNPSNLPDKRLEKKISAILTNISELVTPKCDEKFFLQHYGAYDIDPKYLVIWICVTTERKRMELGADRELQRELRDLLEKYDYPDASRASVRIGFESQEKVDKYSGGNWYHHFK